MLKRESALEIYNNHESSLHSGIKIQELQFSTKINLRGDLNDINFLSSINNVLNISLPQEPNTYTICENTKIIWLSPNEWLINEENENNKHKLLNELINSVGSGKVSVTDVSENRTIIRINGKKIFKLLTKFLVLDLDNNFSKVTSAAQTIFVKVPVLLVRIHAKNEEPMMDIFTNRSHANYIFTLLIDGSKNLHF